MRFGKDCAEWNNVPVIWVHVAKEPRIQNAVSYSFLVQVSCDTHLSMKTVVLFLLMFAASFAQALPAMADACSSRARAAVAGNPNATLLSVQSKVNANGKVQCIARIRIASTDGKPPRIVTRKF